MKLRALVLLLLVANLGFFAWTRGWLDGVGLVPHADREPERLARQVLPQSLRILPPNEAASAMAAGAGANCLEAGPFTAEEADAAEGLLRTALPAGAWTRRSVQRPGDWMIYLGRFTAPEGSQKKAEELRRLQVPFDELAGPADLVPGLSLGHFDDRDAADKALEQLVQRGVRSARVVTVAEPATEAFLRIERPDPTLSGQVAAITGEVKGRALGAAFGSCLR